MMRRLSLLLLGLVLAAAPDMVSADKKDKADSNEPLVKLGDLVATLTNVEGSQKYLAVQYTQQVVLLDQQTALQNNQDLLRRQLQILQDPNPVSRRQQLMQLMAEQQRNQGNNYAVHQVPIDLELQATEEMKVRVLQPPPLFDDKGRPKRYTAKELKDLKGSDPKQPGYAGEFDSLKAGQTVLVSLSQRKDLLKKPQPMPKAQKPPKPADLEAMLKQALQPKEGKEKLLVTRVVVLAEPTPAP